MLGKRAHHALLVVVTALLTITDGQAAGTQRSLKQVFSSSCPDAKGCTTPTCFCAFMPGGLYPSPFVTDCSAFVQCFGNQLRRASTRNGVETQCPNPLRFNPVTKVCDWDYNVQCTCPLQQSPSPSTAPKSPSPRPSPNISPSPSPARSPRPSPTPSPSPSPSPSPWPSPLPSPPPSPSPTPSPEYCGDIHGCPGGDATCWCKGMPNGLYLSPFVTDCTAYIECYGFGTAGVQRFCQPDLRFSEALQVCDWAANVPCNCNLTGPSPSPRPSPSPLSSPSPLPSPSPRPPLPSPAPVPSPPPGTATLPTGPLSVGYYQTWSATWASAGADLDLAKTPSYVNVVMLSFMQPDCTYVKGSMSFAGTGLQWSADATVVRDAIAILKARQPNTRIMLAVGGASYPNWGGLNPQCVKDFVDDFGLHGADVDWEPSSAGCQPNAAGIVASCPTDAEAVNAVTALRTALPKGQYLLSAATFHVGMYGTSAFPTTTSLPASYYSGINLAMARAPAGQSLDLINIMAYDAGSKAGTGFDALLSYDAHKAGWPNAAIALGVEVPPEAWGDNVQTLPDVMVRANYVASKGGHYGMMLWSLHKKTGTPTPTEITQTVCVLYALHNCSMPLPF